MCIFHAGFEDAFSFQFLNMAVCIAEIILLLDFQMGKYYMPIQTTKAFVYGLYDPRLYFLLIFNLNTCKGGSHDHKYISLRTLPLKFTEVMSLAPPVVNVLPLSVLQYPHLSEVKCWLSVFRGFYLLFLALHMLPLCVLYCPHPSVDTTG